MDGIIYDRNELAAKAKKRAKIRKEIIGTLMISAPLFGFIIFTLFPMIVSLVVSFFELHSYNMKYMEFCGWDNYKKLFAIGEFAEYQMPLPLIV